MKAILRGLLWHKKDLPELLLAALGFTVGLFVLFGAIRFKGDVTDLLHGANRETDTRYVIIHKKVNFAHTLGLGKIAFSQEELGQLKQQAFVKDVGSIVTSNFAVAGAVQLGLDTGLQSELFCEAVDERFLDVHPEDWHWQEGDNRIPAIMARDFLVLYNFGYAAAKGLPKLTEEALGLLKAYVVCSGDKSQMNFAGHIVGFSDRFSTILVPMSFMTWANAHIGGKATPPVSRVILEIEPGQEKAVQAYLKSQLYETNQETLPVSHLAETLKLTLWIVSAFGGVLILVSLLSLVLIVRLLISQAREELQLLHQLGFDDGFLARTYVTVFVPVIVVPFVLAGAGIVAVGGVLNSVLVKAGLVISQVPKTDVMMLFVVALMGVLALFYGLIFRTIRRLC